MQKSNLSTSFLFFIFISLMVFFFAKTGILSGPANFIGGIFNPIQNLVFSSTHSLSKEDKLVTENKALVKKLADYQKAITENNALRDQFQTTYPQSQDLLPANVVSAPSFVPGVSSPEYLVINKGLKSGIKAGMAVVLKDNLIGKIESVSDNLSKVILVSNTNTHFSARTVPVKENNKVGALGIIKGNGGREIILDNVLLSDSLSVGDYVATNGDLKTDNTGFPPSLIIGKITSIDKRPSELFQRAKLKSLEDFSKLTIVFVVIKSE